jgi:hypothetical protein
MKTITARFPGECGNCRGPINPGDLILWRKGRRALHANCGATGSDGNVIEIRTSSGWVGYRNRNGRCEDAPCCGCCTC